MNVYAELRTLAAMPMADLKARYADLFGEQTRSSNRDYLVRRIAWRLQARAEGDLSERAREGARELARDADLRVKPPKDGDDATLHPQPQPVGPLRTVSGKLSLKRDPRVPVPGTKLTRNFKGHEYRVIVLPHGFEYAGGGRAGDEWPEWFVSV